MPKRRRVYFFHILALGALLGVLGAGLWFYDRHSYRRMLKTIHQVGSFAPSQLFREVEHRA